MKEVLFEKAAFDKVMVGLNKTANAVVGTIGPKGKNVMIDDAMQPNITNDGHTIASHISFPDKYENLGAWVVKNTSAKTNEDAGDGTTTTAVLLQEIINRSLERPESPMVIKNSLQEACKKVVDKIKEQAKPITLDNVREVALISSESEEIADLVTDIIKKVGSKGIVVVEESRTFETSAEVINGYEAQAGFVSPYFINNQAAAQAEYENVAVLCSQKKISTVLEMKPLFDKLAADNITKIVIVCEDIDEKMLGVLVGTHVNGMMNILVVKANGETLEDIAAVVGASVVSDITGVTFDKFDTSKHLGTAEKVVCSQKKTVFIANSEESKIQAARLKSLADNNTNQYQKEALMKRVGQLTGGIGVIKIGAATDLDRSYRKDKTDDTVCAVKAALEEGIVEGGGMCLWRIAQSIEPKTVGEEILKKALTAPLRKIVENCGKDYAEIVRNMPGGQGYDAKNDVYADLLKADIIDPAKVERVAVENSVSNAALFITTHAVVVDAKVEK